jgi:dimethylargininase
MQASSSQFASDGAGRLTRALLIRPGAALDGVAPIEGEPSPILSRALEQHEVFVRTLGYHGVDAAVLDAPPSGPFAALAADLAVMLPQGALLMRPSDLGRRADVAQIERVLADANVPVLGRIEAPGLLDGGDVLVGSDALYVGVARDRQAAVGIARRVGGNELGRRQLAEFGSRTNLRLIEVPVASDVPRLRSVATFIDRDAVLIAPAFADPAAFDGLQTIEVPRGEDFAAGVLALGGRRVIANLRFRTVLGILRKAKFAVDAIDMWEFGKIGATPSLLALALQRR